MVVVVGVRHIVYILIVNLFDNNFVGVVIDHREIEEVIRVVGVEWMFFCNAIYVEIMVVGAVVVIVSGMFVTNVGDGCLVYVLQDDCAVVVVVVLMSVGYGGCSYDIIGFEVLLVEDIVVIFSEVGGVLVELFKLDDDVWVVVMVEHGMLEAVVWLFVLFGCSVW